MLGSELQACSSPHLRFSSTRLQRWPPDPTPAAPCSPSYTRALTARHAALNMQIDNVRLSSTSSRDCELILGRKASRALPSSDSPQMTRHRLVRSCEVFSRATFSLQFDIASLVRYVIRATTAKTSAVAGLGMCYMAPRAFDRLIW